MTLPALASEKDFIISNDKNTDILLDSFGTVLTCEDYENGDSLFSIKENGTVIFTIYVDRDKSEITSTTYEGKDITSETQVIEREDFVMLFKPIFRLMNPYN